MQNFLIGAAAFAGAFVGYAAGGNSIGWAIGGFFGGMVLAAIIAQVVESAEMGRHERRAAQENARDEADAEDLTKALVEAGRITQEQAGQIRGESWHPLLVKRLQRGDLSFDECRCAWNGEIKMGLPRETIFLMAGEPHKKKVQKAKDKERVTWSYYKDKTPQHGTVLKVVFDDGVVTDFTEGDTTDGAWWGQSCYLGLRHNVHWRLVELDDEA